uniref:Kinase n=1 Tax=Heterorhabditis bacteriophora TaxID=37862 RepID=A0A1I7X4V0_HETBA
MGGRVSRPTKKCHDQGCWAFKPQIEDEDVYKEKKNVKLTRSKLKKLNWKLHLRYYVFHSLTGGTVIIFIFLYINSLMENKMPVTSTYCSFAGMPTMIHRENSLTAYSRPYYTRLSESSYHQKYHEASYKLGRRVHGLGQRSFSCCDDVSFGIILFSYFIKKYLRRGPMKLFLRTIFSMDSRQSSIKNYRKMKSRKDLYEKMTAIDPNEPTSEENACGEITKLRYMQFRERESSSAQMGFRIEAAKVRNEKIKGADIKLNVSRFLRICPRSVFYLMRDQGDVIRRDELRH